MSGRRKKEGLGRIKPRNIPAMSLRNYKHRIIEDERRKQRLEKQNMQELLILEEEPDE